MYTVSSDVISHAVPYLLIDAKAEGPKTLTVIKYQMKYWIPVHTCLFFFLFVWLFC